MKILPNDLPGHPRLFADPEDWPSLRRQVREDPVSARLWATLRSHADEVLALPPVERKLEGARLRAGYTAVDRILTLSLASHIEGGGAYAERAIRELMAVVRFKDWFPDFYLGLSEMCVAVAIGYDWLYDDLTPDQREEVLGALVKLGLETSRDESLPHNRWMKVDNNWLQVCHGGLCVAAIAVADRYPDLAERILRRAVDSLGRVAVAYAPDGAYPEGPFYCDYGTTYHVILAAALRRLAGHGFGIDEMPGFARSAEYLEEVTSPTGRFFNYSDSPPDAFRPIQIPLFWMAARYNRPDWLRTEIRRLDITLEDYHRVNNESRPRDRMLGLALLWYRLTDAKDDTKELAPLNWLGRGEVPLAVFRSAWGDPGATYLAIKGGSASYNHGHMDVGSFILEAQGIRWAVDLGLQYYHSLEKVGVDLWDRSQDGQRWKIFRLGPESHNILRFDDALQDASARADFVAFEPGGSSPHAVLDLAKLHPGKVSSATRQVSLAPNGDILFHDRWVAGDSQIAAAWQMVTFADVEVQGDTVVLRQDGKTLRLEILEPKGANVEITDISAPLPDFNEPNPGARRLKITTSSAPHSPGTFRLRAHLPGNRG